MKIKNLLKILSLTICFVSLVAAPITLDIDDITVPALRQIIDPRTPIYDVTIVRSSRGKQITPEKLQLLAHAFPNIVYLSLRDTGLDGEGIAALQPLLSGAMFSKLQQLDLSQNPLSSSDIYTIKNLEMPLNLKLPPIQAINIAGLDIPMFLSPETFESIKQLGYFKQKALQLSLGVYFRNVNLRDLDVSYNQHLGDLPIYLLIDSTLAQSIEKLNIAYTHPTSEGLEKLASSGDFKKLKSLNLAGNYNFGTPQLYSLASGLGSQLDELILVDTQISNQSESLVRKLFPRLKKLSL